jgi:hypothetical protein
MYNSAAAAASRAVLPGREISPNRDGLHIVITDIGDVAGLFGIVVIAAVRRGAPGPLRRIDRRKEAVGVAAA